MKIYGEKKGSDPFFFGDGMAGAEFALIDWIRRQPGARAAAGAGVRVGIGDDMAVLEVGGEGVLVTTDLLLEGVHFDLARATLEQVGYKAMAASLSDCAAMAAEPWCAVVSVALTAEAGEAAARRLYEGLAAAARRYGCPLVGGDTTSWERPLAVNVTMLARAKGVEPVLRSGAKARDAVFVTGELGGSLAGRHLEFEPRVAEARQLAQMVRLHAMIDVSDGLSQDLDHICQESQVAAVIEAAAVPVSAAARAGELAGGKPALEAALGDGEDFELLFCVGAEDAERLLREWPGVSPVGLTRIGTIVERREQGRLWLRRGGREEVLAPRGWKHL